MRHALALLFTTLLSIPAAFCQQAMTTDQIAPTLTRISQRAARLGPMLEQLHPDEWVAKGAPDTYLSQWTSVREQLRTVESEMTTVEQHPERLADSMKALFRLQGAQQLLSSLMGGVRRYQNPALADLIESVSAEAAGDVDRLEQYLIYLADEKDQQFSVVDREAQRCRATLSRQPEPARTNRKP